MVGVRRWWMLVGAALVLAGPATPVAGAAPGTVRLDPLRQSAVLGSGTISARVGVAPRASWTLVVRRLGRPREVLGRATGRGPARRVVVRLRPAGGRVAGGCRARRLVAELRGPGFPARRHVRRLRLDPDRCGPAGVPRGTAGFRVGTAVRSLAPATEGEPVFLGGYGIGGGGPLGAGRVATGTLPDGLEVRAVAIEAAGRAVVLADAEAQGWFAAVEGTPLGLSDLRAEVARRSGGLVDAQRVVVQANHSHAGPDLLGVWGGVPPSYRRLVFDRTVDAALAALDDLRPASLSYGTTPAGDLLVNQFAGDPLNARLDDELRILEARDPADGRTLATVVNHNAHPTVLGADNLLASGDWTTSANRELSRRTGGAVVTLMGTLGRTQPADRDAGCPGEASVARDTCRVRGYATRVVDRVARARAAAGPVGPVARVDGRSFLVADASTNPVILGLNLAGGPLGAPLARSRRPPWLTGTVVGTTTATVRIGDVLLSAVPGEAYPQIAETVRTLTAGARGWMTMGLAGDQLGYLIAPREAYPEPIRRTLFDERGDAISPIDNDNYLFNVSLTMGERVTCSLLRGAGEVLGRGDAPRAALDRCALYADDLARPAGADVPRSPGRG